MNKLIPNDINEQIEVDQAITDVSITFDHRTSTELKEKISGLVHPSRIKSKKPPKINVKVIKASKIKSVNFF